MRILGLDTSTETGGVALIDRERLVAEYTLSLQRTTHSERLLPAVQRVLTDAGVALSPQGKEAQGQESRTDGSGVGEAPVDGSGVRQALAGGSGVGQAPVDGVAVALGPGSFTGLRIGVVTAKMLSYAWQVPVAGVSTLDALAYQAQGGAAVVCALMDARHGNVYSAVYDTTGPTPVPLLVPGLRVAEDLFGALGAELADIGFAGETVVFTGDGLGVYWDQIQQQLGAKAARVPPTYEQLRCGAVAALGAARLVRGDADDPMQLVPVYLRKSEAERKWAQHAKKPSPS